jgi:hypothetical protein
MIKGISQSGRYTTVSGGSASTPYFNISYSTSANMMIGQIRYNPSTHNMEVYDGASWLQIGTSYASVGLTSEAESLLDWAREKRNEESNWKALAEQHPAVADALETLRLAEERVRIMTTLTKEEPKVQPA